MIEKSKEHLETVSESYIQHMAFAFKMGGACIAAGLMAIIHGILPCCFEKAASERIKKLACACEDRSHVDCSDK